MAMAAAQLLLLSIVCLVKLCTVEGCAGTMTSQTGIIQSPNFPNDYPDNLSCVYVIFAPDQVTLTFTNFDIEEGLLGCTYDYVEVRNGDSESSPILGRYCGTSLPGPLKSSGNQMWVKFVTDGSVTRPGFRAIYTSGCSGTMTSLTGIIQSPNFPSDYTDDLSCVYVIIAPDRYQVALTFTNFDIEEDLPGCTYDYVEVRDGGSESSPILGRYCGTSLPGHLRSSGNQMWIKFVSDESITRAGFRANYTSDIDECVSSPCQNGGTCTDEVNGYLCQCAPGFAGLQCQTDLDECASGPCQNGGTCTDDINSYTCLCAPGYSGVNCNEDLDECASGPCQNGGTCTDDINSYTCLCVPGYSGVNCNEDLDECASGPCQNGGTCTDDINSYTCLCVPGYSGVNCNEDLDECASGPCQNGGTCTDDINSYTCLCAPGYSGVNCNEDVDECVSAPCQNGGTCTDHVNGYLCHCAPGYTDTQCQEDIDECASGPCQNGGTCTDDVNSYTCLCTLVYSGASCNEVSLLLIGGTAGGGGGVVIITIIAVVIFIKRRNPRYVKEGQRENAAQEKPCTGHRAYSIQPVFANEAYNMSDDNEDHVYVNVNGGMHSNNDNSSIPAVLEEGAVGGSGDTVYDKLEKKEDAPQENPYSDVAAPSDQSLNASEPYTVSDHNEDHVYVNVNGAHMIDHSSSISADVKEGTVRDSEP